MQKDLVICQIPFTGTDYPLMAGAVLKSIADKAGWSNIVYDFNKIYYEKLKSHHLGRKVTDFLLHETCDEEILPFIKEMFDYMSDVIISHQPKLVAISLFSYCCKTSATYLCMMIKQKNPNIKIIAGGSGLYDGVSMKTDYGDHMKRMKLFDHYIIGDADHSFYEFLNDNRQFSGIDSSNWDYGVAYQYDGAWSSTIQTTIIVGHSYWTGVTAGAHTIGFGWKTADAGASNRPFNILNPNSTEESRNQQMVSTIILYEIYP